MWQELVIFLPSAAFNRVGRSEDGEGVHKDEGTKVMCVRSSWPFSDSCVHACCSSTGPSWF